MDGVWLGHSTYCWPLQRTEMLCIRPRHHVGAKKHAWLCVQGHMHDHATHKTQCKYSVNMYSHAGCSCSSYKHVLTMCLQKHVGKMGAKTSTVSTSQQGLRCGARPLAVHPLPAPTQTCACCSCHCVVVVLAPHAQPSACPTCSCLAAAAKRRFVHRLL